MPLTLSEQAMHSLVHYVQKLLEVQLFAMLQKLPLSLAHLRQRFEAQCHPYPHG
jgi:hypothetical protein